MIALKCDNCGGYYFYKIPEITKMTWRQPDGSVVRYRDVCPECLAAVSKALEDVKMRKRIAQNKHLLSIKGGGPGGRHISRLEE